MDRLTGVLMAWLLATFGVVACTAEPASYADQAASTAGGGAVVAYVQALALTSSHAPGHQDCGDHGCGNGVVDRGEACDDGNCEDGDGCSANCELDDVAATPGDDRAGYLRCMQTAPEFTCGPGEGCCAQPNPTGPACAADRTACGQNPTFQACDGPEDCEGDLHCVGTRFGNICGTSGYYWACHTDADCESSRPVCAPSGVCREKDVCGDGTVSGEEACDDGNREDGDGCSAECKRDDVTATPGDDRAGYVACGELNLAADLTCGPDQGCCTSGVDSDGNLTGPVCAAARSDCRPAPSFHECDGPEDCDAGVYCMRTRFGNVCGKGSDRVCHTDADCDSSSPSCGPGGFCVVQPSLLTSTGSTAAGRVR